MTTDRIALLLCATFMGCTTPTDSPVAAPTLPPATMPALVPGPTAVLPEGADISTSLGLGEDANVLFTISGKGDEPRLILWDSANNEVKRFARTGSGPGEVRSPAGLWIDGGRALVFDMGALRISAFGLDGEPVWQWQGTDAASPFAIVGDSFYVIKAGASGFEYLVRPRSGGGRPLIRAGDSAFAGLFKEFDEPRPMGRTFGHGRLVLADPMTLTVHWLADGATYASLKLPLISTVPTGSEIGDQRESWQRYRGPDGRPLSPSDIEQRISDWKAKVRPPFAHPYGVGMDGAGRVWLWLDQAGPTRVLILFEGKVLGELPIDCPGAGRAWGVNGHELAAMCERSEGAFELRRWKVVG